MPEQNERLVISRRAFCYGITSLAIAATLSGPTKRYASIFHKAGESAHDRKLLQDQETRALSYFLDGQTATGLILDRQPNHGGKQSSNLHSVSATGMGLMAIAVASSPEHALISHDEAIKRISLALNTVETRLTNDHGMLPHFLDQNLKTIGSDAISTIDSSWLVFGALWAAEYLNDDQLRAAANRIYQRIDWNYWLVKKQGQFYLSPGKDANGSQLRGCWDRLNSETAFMYLLAFGAPISPANPAQLDPAIWKNLCIEYHNRKEYDLGLFAYQYSHLLMDTKIAPLPGGVDLFRDATVATKENRNACRKQSKRFKTYKYFWGLSAGDGPMLSQSGSSRAKDHSNSERDEAFIYRAYTPTFSDGTAHLPASLASIDVSTEDVMENLNHALSGHGSIQGRNVLGTYGLSNINISENFVSPDVVGIDIGTVFFAIENFLRDNRVRKVTSSLAFYKAALARL